MESLSLLALFLCLPAGHGINLKERSSVNEDKECFGTSVSFGYSGTLRFHYNNLRLRYEGCTVVHGNLEITNLDDPTIDYDLSFLSKIRYVSGYVLIGLVSELDIISLPSLEVIRGNRTYRIRGEDFSLVVALTARYSSPHIGLQELHLPALKEIVEGKVLFSKNPALCYINTIPWDKITKGSNTVGRNNSVHYEKNAFSNTCPSCPKECEFNHESACWGANPRLCHIDTSIECDRSCGGLCYMTGPGGCCHTSCAVGCTGPTQYDCQRCRDFKIGEKCVSHCTEETYRKSQNCLQF